MASAAGLVLAGREAAADPQLSAAVTTGLAVTNLRADHAHLAFTLGGRFDALLFRTRPSDMAVGPYVDVATVAFETFETGGGVEWLVPVGDTAFILSAGPFARSSHVGWEPGAESTLFWGSRSYNFHSVYGVGVGVFAQGRWGFGDARQADVIGGVQVDLAYLALPFVFAYEALRR